MASLSIGENKISGSLGKVVIGNILTDPSAWLLLFSNIIVIIFAISQNWSLLTLMMVYLVQSIIIGIFNFFKIVTLKNYTTEGMKMSGVPITNIPAAKWGVAVFFAFHYGIFHLVYLMFVLGGSFFISAGRQIGIDWLYVALSIPLFFLNHLFSFFYNRKNDSRKQQNLGKVMFMPYARIVPMHFTIIFGGLYFAGQGTLILFLGLKTIADLITHAIEHSN